MIFPPHLIRTLKTSLRILRQKVVTAKIHNVVIDSKITAKMVTNVTVTMAVTIVVINVTTIVNMNVKSLVKILVKIIVKPTAVVEVV